jgi:hypothetical protein
MDVETMNDEERMKRLETEVGAMRSLLQKILNPEGKIDVNLTIEEMLVRVTNNGKKTVDVDTSTIAGRIIFCALKDLRDPQQPEKLWSQTDLLRALDERGWHSVQSSVSNAMTKLVQDGQLISKQREGYRTPLKITFVGDEL